MDLEPNLDPPCHPENLSTCIRCRAEHPTEDFHDCSDCGDKVCRRCWGAAVDAHLDCPGVPLAVNAVRQIQEANEGAEDSLTFILTLG